MKIFQRLKEVTALLNQSPGQWCLCGGVAASVYRDSPRFTGDIDFALKESSTQPSKEFAERVLKKLGYEPLAGYIADQKGKIITQQALVIGREQGEGTFVGIDFILPVMGWVEGAVSRAQENLFDFGFARLPTITPVDLCIAKLFALQGTETRFQDRDDILSILRTNIAIDRVSLKAEAARLEIKIPDDILLALG